MKSVRRSSLALWRLRPYILNRKTSDVTFPAMNLVLFCNGWVLAGSSEILQGQYPDVVQNKVRNNLIAISPFISTTSFEVVFFYRSICPVDFRGETITLHDEESTLWSRISETLPHWSPYPSQIEADKTSTSGTHC